jgi:hypothetical protein
MNQVILTIQIFIEYPNMEYSDSLKEPTNKSAPKIPGVQHKFLFFQFDWFWQTSLSMNSNGFV